MLNQTTNKIQSLGFGYKKIDAIKHQLIINGAGDGNRTHVISLEGWSSTIELHPQFVDN